MSEQALAFSIYFDPKIRLFFSVKKVGLEYAECSGYCLYLDDTQTTTERMKIPIKYLSTCTEIVSPHEHPELCVFDGVGWRGRFERRDK